ncbi:MAG: transketolase [Bdellovibrionales bacterium]|nr:transketolase [Bdellovibrionales bacterium]
MNARTLSEDTLKLTANTIRMLSAESVEKAKSGHPGMPMGMAELGAVLWLKFLRFNPQDPKWLARDRFVLSNGHGSMFLYSMLHLSGYDLSIEDLKQFRQFHSKTPGHPESFMTPGVETTTGPLGQGVSNAVGMAIGQKLMAARYGKSGFNPVDHKIFCFCGDGCLMEGVSAEASSVAGHLGLDNLILVYDDNEISIAGHTDLAFTEDVAKRYEAYGFAIQHIDGHNLAEIEAAYQKALEEREKPTMIVARTIIGKGSPNKANTHDVHGAALGPEELKKTKEALNWPLDKEFYVPDEVRQAFAERVENLKGEYQQWQESFSKWKSSNGELAAKLDRQLTLSVPADLEEKLIAAVPTDGKPIATRKLSQAVLQAASANCEALIGGSADLEPSTLTLISGSEDVQKKQFDGKNLRFGVREHGMGGIMNGLAYYGGFIPYGSTFMCFIDYMRPTVRLAALSKLPSVFIYTHDSVFLGEDGPTHQPIEHLAIMRSTPNLRTYRPADGLETAMAYALSLRRTDGPSIIIGTRQNLKPFERPAAFKRDDVAKGGYAVLEPKNGEANLVLIASGSEVPLAVAVAEQLGRDDVRVVSMFCRDLYMAQPKSYRQALVPTEAKKVVIEAATSFGWAETVGGNYDDILFCTIDNYGASAPAEVLAEKFGLTPEQIVARIKKELA